MGGTDSGFRHVIRKSNHLASGLDRGAGQKITTGKLHNPRPRGQHGKEPKKREVSLTYATLEGGGRDGVRGMACAARD